MAGLLPEVTNPGRDVHEPVDGEFVGRLGEAVAAGAWPAPIRETGCAERTHGLVDRQHPGVQPGGGEQLRRPVGRRPHGRSRSRWRPRAVPVPSRRGQGGSGPCAGRCTSRPTAVRQSGSPRRSCRRAREPCRKPPRPAGVTVTSSCPESNPHAVDVTEVGEQADTDRLRSRHHRPPIWCEDGRACRPVVDDSRPRRRCGRRPCARSGRAPGAATERARRARPWETRRTAAAWRLHAPRFAKPRRSRRCRHSGRRPTRTKVSDKTAARTSRPGTSSSRASRARSTRYAAGFRDQQDTEGERADAPSGPPPAPAFGRSNRGAVNPATGNHLGRTRRDLYRHGRLLAESRVSTGETPRSHRSRLS